MEWLGENLWAAWLGAAMVLGLAELASLDLVLLMLAVGALAGMVTAGITDVFAIQALAALATSVAMLVFVRPSIVKRLHSGPDLRAGIDALVGKEGFALSSISVHGGTMKLGGRSGRPSRTTIPRSSKTARRSRSSRSRAPRRTSTRSPSSGPEATPHQRKEVRWNGSWGFFSSSSCCSWR